MNWLTFLCADSAKYDQFESRQVPCFYCLTSKYTPPTNLPPEKF